MEEPMCRFILPVVVATATILASNLSAIAASDPKPPNYHIANTVALGGPDRWDYVTFDPGAKRVYVAHGDRVTVVDDGSGAVIGNVEGMPGGTHGIAILPATGKGYTDDGKAGEVVVFDLKTFAVIKRIKAESDADGIVFDPATDAVVATVDGGGALEFGVTGNNGKFYVDGAEKNEIVRVDTATNKADAHWAMPTCIKPHGLAIDYEHHRLFASCSNKAMVVMNADNGAVIATLPIGDGTDFASFDPGRGLAYSSNRDGTLSVVAEISPDNFAALPAIPTQPGARTMAIDPQSGRIYLVTADMAIKDSAAGDARRRYSVKPGSVRLLFLDIAP